MHRNNMYLKPNNQFIKADKTFVLEKSQKTKMRCWDINIIVKVPYICVCSFYPYQFLYIIDSLPI